jgi:hypothetical protein
MNVRHFSRLGMGALVLVLGSVAAHGQSTNQIRPRVLVMVDTSGSMVWHFADNNTTGGDGSTKLSSPFFTRNFDATAPDSYNLTPYVGTTLTGTSATWCSMPSSTLTNYDGVNSRLYAAKQALTNVVNASGDIDWGLMRYTGQTCGVFTTPGQQGPDPRQPSGAPPSNFTCNNWATKNNKNITCQSKGSCIQVNNNTGICLCASDADCGGGAAGSCNTTNGYCTSNCNTSGVCWGGTCTAATGVCGCSASNQCPYAGEVCSSGKCVLQGVASTGVTCTTDNDCGSDQFCIGGTCGYDGNLCFGGYANYGAVDKRGGQSCGYHDGDLGLSYNGSCGTFSAKASAACATPLACQVASDCGTGTCVAPSTVAAPTANTLSGASLCGCTAGTCPNGWTCAASGVYKNFCVFNNSCQGVGGTVLVDPVTSPSSAVLPYADGIEVISATASLDNPELRAVGSTPLAGAARSAITWYNNAYAADLASSDANVVKAASCRPYVLVQMTDGQDTCDTDGTNGPPAATGAFVAATKSGAKTPNKVYVVGLAFNGSNPGTPVLNSMAQYGGTGQARLANSQQDIEAALADIIASSVLVEKCNGIDDNCNGECDENFPGVAVSATASDGSTCSNPRSATTCDNGYAAGTTCHYSGVDVCSGDQLSQVCGVGMCAAGLTGTVSSGGANLMRITGPNNVPANAVGKLLLVTGAAGVPASDVGVFKISAVNFASTPPSVDVTNAAFSAFGGAVAWGWGSLQGSVTKMYVPGSGTERLNVPVPTDPTASPGLIKITATGDTIYVLGTGVAGYDGAFKVTNVTFVPAVGATPASYNIDLSNAAAVVGKTAVVGQWLDATYCPVEETCNNFDDDCDGIIDDCVAGNAGSCCHNNCPACAKAPFIETCNGCDDDCDGIVDNHLVDTGGACPAETGDCVAGTVQCCNNFPTTAAGCVTDHVDVKGGTPPNLNKLGCTQENKGYPVSGSDLCDGTDDNCNGIVNDGAGQACFTSPAGAALTGSPNCMGTVPAAQCFCHAGTQSCTQPTVTSSGPSGTCPGTDPNPNGAPTVAGSFSFPPNMPCPNPNPATRYGACTGAQGGQAEICNGIDDDCDGVIDDNLTDTWTNPGDPSHQCCTPGGNCNNTGGSMQCTFGGYVCQNGTKTCVGAIPQSPEICDGIDNDCNGIVDDVPGVGNPCTGNGVMLGGACQARLQCVAGNMQPQCVQTVGPVMEMCNGIDDDCDGVIDNPPFAPTPGMPVVGTACDVPVPPADNPPCKAGTNVCVAGSIVCQGAVGPMPNQCNGVSTDCTGMPNVNGNCPTGFQCYQGNCVQPCSQGEFPCAGGYVCNPNTNACDTPASGHIGCCVPDACAKAKCPTGDICQLDASGNANCVDPCSGIDCGAGYVCKGGACEDASCRTQGCPTGQICSGTPPTCVADPCAGVTCSGNTYCDNGQCVQACSGPCPAGENCMAGKCVGDPCAHVNCPEGQSCTVSGTTGTCVLDQCGSSCSGGQICCGGSCTADPCMDIHCPDDTHCTVTSACSATCNTNPASAKDQVVGAGGGGFGCDVSNGRGDGGAFVLVLIAALLWMRRRKCQEGVQ